MMGGPDACHGGVLSRLLVVLTCVFAFSGGPRYASANDVEEAAGHFRRGLALFEAGDHEAALAEFKRAYAIKPNHKVLFNIGLTAIKLFRYGEALTALERYQGALPADTPDAHRRRVSEEIENLRQLVATLQLEVETPAGAEIYLDGALVGTAPHVRAHRVRAGAHRVRVVKDGHRTKEITIVSVSGQVDVRRIALHPIKASPATLLIRTEPHGASLSVDGRPIGVTPWKGSIEPGGHLLALELQGFEPLSREIVLSPGQLRPLSVTLLRDSPFYKRWPFWAAVGGAALVGTFSAVYFATRDDGPDAFLVAR